MRGLLAIALAGCGFTHGSSTDPTGGGGAGGATDAANVPRPACDVTDPAVQLCLDFEMPSALGLDSSAGMHDATVSNAIAMPRMSQQAVTVGRTSSIQVAETPALDITGAITVELWLDPSDRPMMTYSGLDNAGQYSISITHDGLVHCTIAGADIASKDALATGSWTHVGCTYDGAQLILYIDGSATTCTSHDGAISTMNMMGTTIGVPFVGGIDNVHLLSRAVLADEMCMHAGQSQCQSQCEGG